MSPYSEVYSALIAHCWKPGCCSWPRSVPLTSVHSCFRLQRRTLGSSSFSLENVPIWNYFGFLVLSGEGKVLANYTCSDLCFKNIKHEVLICWVPSQVTASLLVCVSQDKIRWAPSIIVSTSPVTVHTAVSQTASWEDWRKKTWENCNMEGIHIVDYVLQLGMIC